MRRYSNMIAGTLLTAGILAPAAGAEEPQTLTDVEVPERVRQILNGEKQYSVSYANASKGGDSTKAEGPRMTMELPVSTQGPFWPPATVADAEGNFLQVGITLQEAPNGSVVPVAGQAVLVDRSTQPALTEDGKLAPDRWFAADHDVIRPLGLSDLDTVLHSLSFGPVEGHNSPRIPRAGTSEHNLNGNLIVCEELFPADSQAAGYTRPSYPLHEVPVLGFQGDNVAYDVDTGEAVDPMTATSRPGCAASGCPGEDRVDHRSREPITLLDWLRSKGALTVTLTQPNENGVFTHARFSFELEDMLPNAVYTVGAVRPRQIPVPGVFERRNIDPLAVPNIIVTDADGNGRASFEVPNPFPAPESDLRGLRIIGLSVVYHSDHQNWGACFNPWGSGVTSHPVFNTLNRQPPEGQALAPLTRFVTVAP